MNWVVFLVFVGFVAVFFWQLDSIGERISGRVCGKLDSIDSELQDIRSKLGVLDSELRNIKSELSGIHDEFKWYEKDSSVSRILDKLDNIDTTIGVLALSK